MIAKVSFLAGLATGYVLGTRAGRDRYEQIASTVREVWRDPRVQAKADQAQRGVKEAADKAASAAGDAAKTAADKASSAVSGTGADADAPDPGSVTQSGRVT